MKNIICWNIRGCNLPGKQEIVRDLIKEHKPGIIMLQETKIKENKIKGIARRMWKEAKWAAIGAVGKSGGLWTMWDPTKFEAERIQCNSNRCLTIKVTCKSSKFSFFISNIYAPNVLANRRRFWTCVSHHRLSFQQAHWLLGGGFQLPFKL